MVSIGNLIQKINRFERQGCTVRGHLADGSKRRKTLKQHPPAFSRGK
jgi:hypothetical protein